MSRFACRTATAAAGILGIAALAAPTASAAVTGDVTITTSGDTIVASIEGASSTEGDIACELTVEDDDGQIVAQDISLTVDGNGVSRTAALLPGTYTATVACDDGTTPAEATETVTISESTTDETGGEDDALEGAFGSLSEPLGLLDVLLAELAIANQ
ncbi:hypothetical protein HT102_00800 [Hoyosella sp. G463]|uniref:Ig-like domain-containing protein n=1 Tax=Lolliginicoccus lacisalsi TaxID=2742202 RepID=A0A927PL49_9ACTN|nr:hypothetical protein [Lolliginicoccus lacisalsi]MBD8505027.1 hypothetical protein [Lolliginicoccus lacisalsi]